MSIFRPRQRPVGYLSRPSPAAPAAVICMCGLIHRQVNFPVVPFLRADQITIRT
jgi:hypothetical protein